MLVTCDSPWSICPTGTGKCCVWLGRPQARCDTVQPGSLSRAHKSVHLRPGGQGRKGLGVTVSSGLIQFHVVILNKNVEGRVECRGDAKKMKEAEVKKYNTKQCK